MSSEGVDIAGGRDNQVAREGRGMWWKAKQAAGNETSDGQAAASVSDMGGEQVVEEVDCEGRPSQSEQILGQTVAEVGAVGGSRVRPWAS